MGKAMVEIDESTRDRLRRFKAIDGLTYDEAITELLDDADWTETHGDTNA